MADKKLKIALGAGVAAVVILMTLLLTTCSGEAQPAPTVPAETQQVTVPPETQATQPPTEAPTEPNEVPTEPTEPEATEESTGGSSTPGGSSSGSGGSSDTPKETEPYEAPAAGSQENPYVEVLSADVQEITTVNLKTDESVYYALYGAADAILQMEATDVTLTLGETDYKPDENGTIELPLHGEADPVVLKLTNSGALTAAYQLHFVEPGVPVNPKRLTSIDTIAVELAKGNQDGYHYVWTATDTCEVTLMPGKTNYVVYATYDGNTVSNADSADGKLVLNVEKGMKVELKAIAKLDEDENYPKVSDVIIGYVPAKGSLKNPIELENLTPDALELAGGEDYVRYYSWTAAMDGTFAVQVTGAEPETVVCGVTLNPDEEIEAQALASEGTLEVKASDRVVIKVETAPDETGTYPAAKITFTCSFVAKPGLEANPIVVNVPADTLTIPSGGMIYYQAAAAGMQMTITGENLNVIIGGSAYEPTNGKTIITCTGATTVFAVANLGEEDATFEVAFVKIEVPPTPSEPDPTDPDPTDPDPTDPDPTDPEPTEPEPTEPEPTEPEPTDPDPTEPDPTDPEPTEPEESEPTEPEETTEPTGETPDATNS